MMKSQNLKTLELPHFLGNALRKKSENSAMIKSGEQPESESSPLFFESGWQNAGNRAYHHFESVQPKLEVSEPGDSFETEADEMASRALKKISLGGSGEGNAEVKKSVGLWPQTPVIQRKCESCEEEETLMRKSEAPVTQSKVTPGFQYKLRESKGAGKPLPEKVRTEMETGFGADFSQVRLHGDQESALLSTSIRAKAFTYGQNIYFNSGRMDFNSSSGRSLLAHELAHTLQQSGGKKGSVQRRSENEKPDILRELDPDCKEAFIVAANNELRNSWENGIGQKKETIIRDIERWIKAPIIGGRLFGRAGKAVNPVERDKCCATLDHYSIEVSDVSTPVEIIDNISPVHFQVRFTMGKLEPDPPGAYWMVNLVFEDKGKNCELDIDQIVREGKRSPLFFRMLRDLQPDQVNRPGMGSEPEAAEDRNEQQDVPVPFEIKQGIHDSWALGEGSWNKPEIELDQRMNEKDALIVLAEIMAMKLRKDKYQKLKDDYRALKNDAAPDDLEDLRKEFIHQNMLIDAEAEIETIKVKIDLGIATKEEKVQYHKFAMERNEDYDEAREPILRENTEAYADYKELLAKSARRSKKMGLFDTQEFYGKIFDGL